ncbi:MAG: hypothetical protein AB7O62_23065 [Pirellulales bacterium]
MATPNRAAILTKIHKVLKKHYQDAPPVPELPVLEQLLFAICLENAAYAKAEATFELLRTTFFDWNEVRVSSIKELSEVMRGLPDPISAATALRRCLQSVFEATYSFDLESLKKPTQGQALQRLEKFGLSPFVIACITQWSLGGHSIPLDKGALWALEVLGLVNEAQSKEGTVPGLERAIPKNKGVEFGGLLHQLSAEIIASPYSPNLHKLLLDISPEAKARLPRRPTKKEEAEAAAAAVVAAADARAKAIAARKEAEILPQVKRPVPPAKPGAKPASPGKKTSSSAKKDDKAKPSAKKQAAAKDPGKKPAAGKSKSAPKPKAPTAKRKPR